MASERRKPGRIPKLETVPELSEFLVKAIRAGCPVSHACQACGISSTAFWRWMATGEKANAPEVYRQFHAAIKLAQRDRLLEAVQSVQAAAPRQWQAAAWWLERSSPENWASPEIKLRSRELEAGLEDLRRQFLARFPDAQIPDPGAEVEPDE